MWTYKYRFQTLSDFDRFTVHGDKMLPRSTLLSVGSCLMKEQIIMHLKCPSIIHAYFQFVSLIQNEHAHDQTLQAERNR